MEVEASVSLSVQKEDSSLRDFFMLDLERPKVAFLPSVWTVVHPIGEQSPFYQLTQEDLERKEAEIIVMMKAFDESFSQTVYSRSSYKASEVKWGEKFAYLITHEKGKIVVDASRIDETEKSKLNF